MPPEHRRRPVLSAIGYAGTLPAAIDALCIELGERAIEAGFRIATGGLGGVMEAVSRGARGAPHWCEGDVIGVLPSYDRRVANPYVDIVIPTGMQIARNVIVVAMADVVVAVGGGSGTLSEMAVAWQLGKPIIALASTGGWAEQLAGQRVDERSSEPIERVETAEEAIRAACRRLDPANGGRREPGDVGSGWRKRDP